MLKMKNEKLNTYKLEPLFEHFNESHDLKPFGYQHLINALANAHLKDTNQAAGVLLAEKYAWVLVSMSFEVLNNIKEIKTYIGKTWFTERKGPYYRREFMIEDEQGIIYLKGASHSVLLDLNLRSIYRQKKLPFDSFKETKDFLIDCEPRFKNQCDYKTITEEKKVLNSYIDPFGHVNNLRYTEFIYDVLTDDEIKNINDIKRFDLYFHNELTKDNQFIINKSIIHNKKIYEIFNITTNMKAFSIVLTLIKV